MGVLLHALSVCRSLVQASSRGQHEQRKARGMPQQERLCKRVVLHHLFAPQCDCCQVLVWEMLCVLFSNVVDFHSTTTHTPGQLCIVLDPFTAWVIIIFCVAVLVTIPTASDRHCHSYVGQSVTKLLLPCGHSSLTHSMTVVMFWLSFEGCVPPTTRPVQESPRVCVQGLCKRAVRHHLCAPQGTPREGLPRLSPSIVLGTPRPARWCADTSMVIQHATMMW